MTAMATRSVLLVGAATVVLGGCFTTTADFKRDAEAYIAADVADAVGATFESVTCQQPVDQDVGTRFTCSAIDDAGQVWEFDNEIDAPGEFTVNLSKRP